MTETKSASRLLGGAFLFVLVASFVSTELYSRIAGSGSMSETLSSVAANVAMMRASMLIGLFTSAGIVVLSVAFYVVMKGYNRILALIALGWWIAEAITLAVSKIGGLALIRVSIDFVEAGSPEASHFQTIGTFLHHGLILDQGDAVHMLFYSLGGVLWFFLLYRSRYIPRVLSGAGLAIETLGLIGMLVLLSTGITYGLFFFPIALLELVAGLWFVIKGVESGHGAASLPAHEAN